MIHSYNHTVKQSKNHSVIQSYCTGGQDRHSIDDDDDDDDDDDGDGDDDDDDDYDDDNDNDDDE